MFISSMWDVKEPTDYSKRVAHEVPFLAFVSVLAKLIYLAWSLGYRSYITLHFFAKSCRKKKLCGCKNMFCLKFGIFSKIRIVIINY